jgi:hypothetical protein
MEMGSTNAFGFGKTFFIGREASKPWMLEFR